MSEVKYHIGLSREMIGGAKYVLLPGDPGRVEGLAKSIDANTTFLSSNREYTSYLGEINDKKFLVCSTGMGCPSVGIGVEELASLGVEYFIRVGTSGAIQPNINLGDLVVSTSAVRRDGTSRDYAPIEYPAVADFKLTLLLEESSKELNIPVHTGITITSDTFWPGQERYDSFTGHVPKELRGSMEEWQRLGALNYEMETATLFVMCSIFRLKAACICGIVANRTISEEINLDISSFAKERCQLVLKQTLSKLMCC